MLAYCLFLSLLCLSIPGGKSFPNAQLEYRLPPHSCSKVTKMTKQIKCAPENLLVCCGGTPSTDNKEKCVTPNKEEAECISVYSCPNLLSALGSQHPVSLQFVQQSNCGGTAVNPMVCCGPSSNFTLAEEKTPTEDKATDKMSLLPSKWVCGNQHSDDYFRNETLVAARINEFPWLAAIVFSNGFEREVQCAGSLINRRYVLTAAHCLLSRLARPVAVHLGEYDITMEKDCVQEPPYKEECSDSLQVFDIEKIIPHPDYKRDSSNDIALIRLNTTAGYNDYVRPVCLPFPGTTMAGVGDVLTSSGWGRINYGEDQVTTKKRILSKLINTEECKKFYPDNSRKPITDNHICVTTLNNSRDISCHGDSGGPLIFRQSLWWYLEGISSFGRACGLVPDVYVKVAKYLDWILENIKK